MDSPSKIGAARAVSSDEDDTLANFSNFGADVDLIASAMHGRTRHPPDSTSSMLAQIVMESP
jgi:hypothetical protein